VNKKQKNHTPLNSATSTLDLKRSSSILVGKLSIVKITYRILLGYLIVILVGCSSPAAQLNHHASLQNLKKIVFSNQYIPLIAYTNITHHNKVDTAYIYLEGDGRPWDRGRWPASDPNTQVSVMLPLLATTTKPSLYLARPCYGWTTLPTLCEPMWWTSGRYSQQVLDILNDAIDQHKISHKVKQYVVAGHSGGGALAMLLAAKRKDIIAVITLAGNLDHQTWTQHFGYLPLTHSLAPPPSNHFGNTQYHLHLVAGQDKVIPAPLTQKALSHYPNAHSSYYPNFTHTCCWETVWPSIIKNLDTELNHSLKQ